jgi:hypothetical protein
MREERRLGDALIALYLSRSREEASHKPEVEKGDRNNAQTK